MDRWAGLRTVKALRNHTRRAGGHDGINVAWFDDARLSGPLGERRIGIRLRTISSVSTADREAPLGSRLRPATGADLGRHGSPGRRAEPAPTRRGNRRLDPMPKGPLAERRTRAVSGRWTAATAPGGPTSPGAGRKVRRSIRATDGRASPAAARIAEFSGWRAARAARSGRSGRGQGPAPRPADLASGATRPRRSARGGCRRRSPSWGGRSVAGRRRRCGCDDIRRRRRDAPCPTPPTPLY
ncbi:hypothetical protein OJF2_42710 [Aquisphaera giovannonii]|uniref:Uncharacterized protein n=1 Tax=Aquisphaera giovannonii TaxID=406548 RepID=A0A5B9W666_9BACT|nr:hypothetical protein OJF2_42710 [Aquisphaera giovannonii]